MGAVGTTGNNIPDGPGKGNVFIGATGQLAMWQTTETIDGLNGAGTVNNPPGGGSTLTVGNGNASGTFSGVPENTGAALSLTKMGSGTQVLSGNNTYSGGTIVGPAR